MGKNQGKYQLAILVITIIAVTLLNGGISLPNWSGSKSEETVMAPVRQWSTWINVPCSKDVNWVGDDPFGERFTARYVDSGGNIHDYSGTPFQKMRAVSFKSTSNEPAAVHLEWSKATRSNCS